MSHRATPVPFVLTWSPTCIEVWALDETGPATTRVRCELLILPEQRHALTLRMASKDRGWLRAPAGVRAPFFRIEDGVMSAVPPVPGSTPVDFERGRLQIGDSASLLVGESLYVIGPELCWRARPLPKTLMVSDASIDESGGLWLCGSVPSDRIPNAETEAAVRYQSTPAEPYQSRSPKLGVVDAARVIRSGGMERLRTIDAEAEPILVTSDCAWFTDDPSSFIFVRSRSGNWAARRVAERSIRRLLRTSPGQVLVVTVEGDLFTIDHEGNLTLAGRADTLRAALFSIAKDAPNRARMIVRGVDRKEQTLAVSAGLYIMRDGKMSWVVNAVCTSTDSGGNWRVLASTFPVRGEAELLDIAFPGHWPATGGGTSKTLAEKG